MTPKLGHTWSAARQYPGRSRSGGGGWGRHQPRPSKLASTGEVCGLFLWNHSSRLLEETFVSLHWKLLLSLKDYCGAKWLRSHWPPASTHCSEAGERRNTIVCVYVCMYEYMHLCMFACIYICLHASVYVYMHSCTHVSMYECRQICIYITHRMFPCRRFFYIK